MQRTNVLCLITGSTLIGTILASSATSQVGPPKSLVVLQSSTPGVSQSGHSNISGTTRSGLFVGDGSGLTNLNAANLQGVIPISAFGLPLTLSHVGPVATLELQNSDLSGLALKLSGNFDIGGRFTVNSQTGSALSLGDITGNNLAALNDASIAQNLSVGNHLDMTLGEIKNIGSSSSAFNAAGGLDLNSSLSVSVGTSSLNVTAGGALFLSPTIEILGTSIFETSLSHSLQSNTITFGPSGNILMRVDVGNSETVALKGFRLAEKLVDGSNSAGLAGNVLTSTSSATKWMPLFNAAGDMLTFNGDVSLGGAAAPRIFSVERNPNAKVTVRGTFETLGAVMTDNSYAMGVATGTPATATHIKSPSTNVMSFHTNSIERGRLDANGNWFFGTTTGAGRVNVNGNLIMQGTGSIFANDMTMAATGGSGRAYAFSNGGFGEMRARNSSGLDIFLVTGPASGFVDAFVAGSINNAGTALNGGFQRRQGTNTVDLFANGTKSFVEPNPDDAQTDIWYAALEGPEAAMYVRGTGTLVNGRCTILLPDHFTALADEEGMTVQLTAMSIKSRGLAVISQGLAGIEVGELMDGKGNYKFHWEVKSVRSKHRDFEVLRPWDNLLLPGANRNSAWEARIRQMRNPGRS